MMIVRRMIDSLSPHLYFFTSQYIFWMLICLRPVCTQERKITCSIPSVPPLHDTVLTCHFPEDLSLTKKDFTVYHNVQHDIPESVLDCWWIKGVLDCYTKPGFKFDRRVSQTLNTTIHNVTMASTGSYTCQVAGYASSFLETCELSLKPVSGSKIKCSLSSTTLTCLFDQDVQKTQKRFAVYRHNAKENQSVVNCSWKDGILYCHVEDGYFFDKEVSSYIQVEIPSTDTKVDAYTCLLEGSDADELAMCFLETESKEGHIICTIPPVKMSQDAVLSCNFPEDLNVTKKDFAIYHYLNNNRDDILDCWWLRGEMTCSAKPDIVYQTSVNRSFTISLLNVSSTHTGQYACQVANYDPTLIKTCHLQIKFDAIEDRENTLAVVVSIVLVGAVLLAILIIVVMLKRRRRCRCKRKDGTESQEDQPMIAINDKKVTVEFQEFLLKKVREIFPDMRNTCYFVPSIYFNKTRYKTETVAGQVVYIPDPPDPGDVQYNQVMQKVLLCLRNIVKTKHERMFVLTNFNYDDYLNNPDHSFIKHGLPVPAGLKKQKGDNEISCVDFLIIHRRYGVVVGVVKTVSDKDDGSEDRKKKIDHLMVTEVSEAILQLTKAVRMIKHLISDQNHPLKVRQTIVLPSAASSTLNRVLHNHPDLAQKLRKCFQTKDVPVHLCLCGDSPLMTWWGSLMTKSTDDCIMKDDLYECLIARFCGPATTSAVDIPRTPDGLQVPKTVDQAVSVIGDLFDRCTLYPGMTDLIQEPRVFLSGPPGTGKTRLLGLVGRKWLSEGHVVQIVNTSTELTSSTLQLVKILQEAQSSGISPNGMVVSLNCNTKRRKDIRDLITNLKATAGEKSVCVLVDDLEVNAEKSQQIHKFFKSLLMILPNINCWASSCSTENAPEGWRSEVLTIPISCPPTVLREAMKEKRIPGVPPYSEIKFTPPTEGMPVISIPHELCPSSRHIDYKMCGKEILKFLSQVLRISGIGANPGTMDTLALEHQRQYRQPTALQYRDLLMLFEDDVTQFMPVVTAFKESGIPVQIIDYKNQEDVLNNNLVVAANAGFLLGIKRKVVIYVKGNTEPSDISVSWNKLRSITNCTSQLVLVSEPFEYFMNKLVTVAENVFTNLFGPI